MILKKSLSSLGLILILTVSAKAALVNQVQKISDQQLIHQQERQKALQEELTPSAPKVSLAPKSLQTGELNFPQESPCFPIYKVELLNQQNLSWLMPLNKIAQQGEHQCIGSEGFNLLMDEIQNTLINYGYVTTRVVVPEQDISSGVLQLLLVEGKVRNIYYADDSDTYATLYTAMPVRKNGILNLRDIEQGLENLQRVPTVVASMEIKPGDEPGESDVVITRKQQKFWRAGLSLDDSGTRTTGRYQGGVTFYLDNLLSLSDVFYVSGGHDLDHKGKYGTRNFLFSYTVPYGYWLLNASLSGNKYHQTVAGNTTDYEYSGRSRNANIQLSRILHRSESQKTTFSYGILLRESHNYINDTEIDVQARKTTQWQIGLNHRQYLDNITLDGGVSLLKGVRWFGAKKAPEESNPEDKGTPLAEIIKINFSAAVPFAIKNEQFRYNFDYQGQYTRKGKLTSPDQFSIGGRWSVRGFDGELTLRADRGWYLRNELAWQAPYNHEPYLGLDTGGVAGAKNAYLLGRHLTGGAIGVRGNNFGFYYDLFAGAPIKKPEGFKTDDVTLGFNLNYNF